MALPNSSLDNFTFLCHQTTDILLNPIFHVVLIVEMIECIISAVMNICLLFTIWRITVFHPNLRLLLFDHSFNLTIFALALAGKAIYILLVWHVLDDPCRLVTSLYDCKLIDTLVVVPLMNTIYSLVALCLERAYATVFYKKYEMSKIPWVACILIPCIWLSVLITHFLPLSNIPKNQYMPICYNVLSMTPPIAQRLMAQGVLVETVAVTIAVGLFIINRRLLVHSAINRAKHTLTARFQIYQNVTVNGLLCPTVLCHAVCFICQCSYMLLVMKNVGLDKTTQIILININFIVLKLYSIVHPILAIMKNPHMKKIVDQWINKLPEFMKKKEGNNERPQLSANALANFHFEQLEKMWNSEASKVSAVGTRIPREAWTAKR